MADIEFIDAEKQASPAALPEKDANKTTDPLGAMSKERTVRYKEYTDSIVQGRHVVANEREKGERWYREQIETLSKYGYIAQTRQTYVSSYPLHTAIANSPTSHFLIQHKQDIKARLPKELQNRVRIAGTDFANKSTITQKSARENALLTIAPSGDLNTLKEILDTVDAKIRQREKNLDAAPEKRQYHEIEHPLIIENTPMNGDNFWDGVLRGIKILDYDENTRQDGRDRRRYVNLKDLAATYGIYITSNRDETIKLANALGNSLAQTKKQSLQETPHRSPAYKRKEHGAPIVPDNSIIFVATATRKKFDLLQEIYKKRGINVRMRPIYELTDAYVGPEEDTKTYEGNVAKKLDAALDAWEIMDVKTRSSRLNKLAKECGIPTDQIENHIFFLGEDSGFEFRKEGVLRDHRFDDIEGIDPNERQPGVETGPTIFAKHGVSEFFRKAGEIVPQNQRQISMKCVVALTPLKKDEYGKRPKYMVLSETRGNFTTEPKPAAGALEIDNFIIPKGEKETEAELFRRGSDYTSRRSNKALAWEGLALETGITLDGKGITDDYSKHFVVGVMAGDNRSSQVISDKLEKQVGGDGFGVVKMGARMNRPLDIQNQVLEKSDAVVLAFDPERAKEDFWENTYTFMSLVVGEQTHDKYKLSKPLKLINPKTGGKGAFDYLEDMVQDFHVLGTIPQDPATLYQSVGSIDQAVEALKKERTGYRRMEVPAYAKATEPNAVDGSASHKDFNVAIFCSATSKNSKYIKDAHDLAEALIRQDIGLVSGAGLYSAMGAVTKVADELRHSGHGAHHSGSNVRHLMMVEGDARDKLNQFLLARNIYERMEFMMDNSDAFVIAPGGSGTVQEFALVSLLKKRAVEDGKDDYASQKMGGKDIVILNSKFTFDGQSRGFYDKLIALIPKEDFEKLGIHIVQTPEQAQAKLSELRERKLHGNTVSNHQKTGHAAAVANQREQQFSGASLH